MTTEHQQAKNSCQGLIVKASAARLCNCIGPQRGEPVCPCQMANVRIVDGRYVMTRDLGPAPVSNSKYDTKEPS